MKIDKRYFIHSNLPIFSFETFEGNNIVNLSCVWDFSTIEPFKNFFKISKQMEIEKLLEEIERLNKEAGEIHDKRLAAVNHPEMFDNEERRRDYIEDLNRQYEKIHTQIKNLTK